MKAGEGIGERIERFNFRLFDSESSQAPSFMSCKMQVFKKRNMLEIKEKKSRTLETLLSRQFGPVGIMVRFQQQTQWA